MNLPKNILYFRTEFKCSVPSKYKWGYHKWCKLWRSSRVHISGYANQ